MIGIINISLYSLYYLSDAVCVIKQLQATLWKLRSISLLISVQRIKRYLGKLNGLIESTLSLLWVF